MLRSPLPIARRARAALGSIAIIALASCAPVEEADDLAAAESSANLALAEEGEDCFFSRNVTGFSEAPDGPSGAERIFVEAAGDTYLFETIACPALNYSFRLGFDPAGIGQICRGFDVDLIVPDPTFGAQRCPVRMVRKVLNEEEVR